MPDDTPSNISLAATIVASFVANNTIAPSEVPAFLKNVKAALDGTVHSSMEPVAQEPAHPLKRLVTPDAIFCAECGKQFKSLKRHLASDHALTPEAYRAKWSLRNDSPMVAPNYAARRSELAKMAGLGRKAPPQAPDVKQRAKPGSKLNKTAPSQPK